VLTAQRTIFESSDLSASTGAQATDVTLGGSQLAGVITKSAIIVDELVSADVSTGSAVSDATIALGDDAMLTASLTNNCTTGDSVNQHLPKQRCSSGGATASGHLVSAVDVTSNGTGNGFGNATKGKFRILLAYYPTAGEHFSN
jgi:hypothetical protein